MATVSKPLTEVAREFFTDLGYTVTGEGDEIRAVRDWKDVRVVPVEDGETVATDGDALRCFVSWRDRAADLERSIRAADPPEPWAVVALSPDGDHEVVRAPAVAD